MSVWRKAGEPPELPNGWKETVGSDSSSATKGSSILSVAGKNRCPMIPCASAADVDAERMRTRATGTRIHPKSMYASTSPLDAEKTASDLTRECESGEDELGGGTDGGRATFVRTQCQVRTD